MKNRFANIFPVWFIMNNNNVNILKLNTSPQNSTSNIAYLLANDYARFTVKNTDHQAAEKQINITKN